MSISRFAALLTLALLTASCARLLGRASTPDEFDEEQPRHLTVEVDNQNFYDATIYAVQPGQRMRIGQVVGLTKETFQFLWPSLDLRMEIYLISVGSYYTWPLDVQPGDQLALTVLPNLHTRTPGTVF